ncbi:hypothetical protein ACWCQ1_50385 [Streptomyces sp. NPDC002144]
MELNATGDLGGGRVGHVTDPQRQFAEVLEEHPAGGPDPAIVRVEADHRLLAAQCTPHLALDQAAHGMSAGPARGAPSRLLS